ncbi:MAG: HAMP domain-containing histidine kinase [Casimicrobiaceae bacterium]|nr:HAMP domain-containing histidine kinase [Casimicrobiaceae bacterium]
MRSLDRLSYRWKLPLALVVAILATEVVVAFLLITRARSDGERDVEAYSANLLRVLAYSLAEPLQRDEVWQAFELVRTPLAAATVDNPVHAIVVLDREGQVFASTQPRRWSIGASASVLPDPLRGAALEAIAQPSTEYAFTRDRAAREFVGRLGVVAEDGSLLGHVLVSIDAGRIERRQVESLINLAWISVPGVVGLLLAAILWGHRIATPLVELAAAVERITPNQERSEPRPSQAAGDEIVRLRASIEGMARGLARLRELEAQMLAAERLAVIGRVSAGVAHEINNPLGGLLNTVDTLRRHGPLDERVERGLGLIERGLRHIQVVVSALLTEYKRASPITEEEDWEDLRALIAPHAEREGVRLDWRVSTACRMRGAVAVPSQPLRQIVLNLLLNAVRAARRGGEVSLEAELASDGLLVRIANTGLAPEPELLERLNTPGSAELPPEETLSRGLGLWVTRQIVGSLGGGMQVTHDGVRTVFEVTLPLARARPNETSRRAVEGA